MGFSFTSIAVRGGTRDSVLAALGLRGTDAFEEVPESDTTGVLLPSGWYLLVAQREPGTLAEDAVLGRLSETAEVVTCTVEEHVMCGAASSWVAGRRVWSVVHASEQGENHLETHGNLPPMFAPIRDRLQAEQDAEGGGDTDVDHLFDIPVEMFAQLTGYRHDRVMPELGDQPFEVLEPIGGKPKRSLWSRLLGR